MALQGTYFNSSYYLTQYADVAANWSGSARSHYQAYGAAENRAPNSWFNAQYYRATYTDLQTLTALQLFEHYENYGYKEGRWTASTYANFDAATYLSTYADLGKAGITTGTALNHYLVYGASENRVAKTTSGQTISGTSSTSGTTYTLTTGIDTPGSTSGNDTYLGDSTATATLNAGDQIDGGAGTDTLKMYGNFGTGANVPITIKNIEVLDLVTADNVNIDLTAWPKSTTGIGTFVVENAAALNAKTITTTAGQALSLSTGGANSGTAGAVTWAASATDTSETLTLNGYQGGTGAAAQAMTITGAACTTLNLASTGAANKITTFTLGAVTNKVVITGDQNFTASADMVSSGGATTLKTIDASAATGKISIKLAAATNSAFAFTGGSGDDTLTLADNGLAVANMALGSQLDGGAGTGDKLGIFDTALTAAELANLNLVKNFEKLGLNAAITLDASGITNGIKSFSSDTDANQSLTNLATGSTVTITAAHGSTMGIATAVGVTDLTLNIGTSTTTGLTNGGVFTVGATSVALTSNGTNAAANTLTLANADNSTYTVTGSNDLTVTLGSVAPTAIGSKIDATNFTGKLNATGNTKAFAAGSTLGDYLIGGSAADTLKAAKNSSTLTGNGGNDTFDVSAAPAAAAQAAGAGATTTIAITTITDFTKGDKITFAASASAFTTAKVDLSGAASLGAALDLLIAGNNTDVKWGVYGGNTYLADDVDAAATIGATDTIVKCTGTLDLSTSTFAGNTLTFA